MSDNSKSTMISLKLLIDKDKDKVVFAESGQDFVDILFSLSTLPMGTIIRLLEKSHQRSTPIGCFNNIYESVVTLATNHFKTEACKEMLLFPRNSNQEKHQKLKLKIDDSEARKCFMCPSFVRSGECSKKYSNFNTSKCSTCKNLMNEVIQFQGEASQGSVGDGVFVKSGYNSFVITDDLKVEVNSVGLTLKLLNELGYADCDKLVEMILDVNLQEVTKLLECIFTSETPLTDTFLKRKSSNSATRVHKTLNPTSREEVKESKAVQTIKLNAYVRKKEGDIIYVECNEDFVDLLFTFLAMPLESVMRISGDVIILGNLGNLCKSFEDLRRFEVDTGFKCVLPHYYKCQNRQLQLEDVVTTVKSPTYYRYVSFSVDRFTEYSLTENSSKIVVYDWDKLVPVVAIDPKSEGDGYSGFVKKGSKFMVTDDLRVSSSNSTSTLGMLKEKQIQLADVEFRVINMRKEEVIRLLGASLVTSSPLSTALLGKDSVSTSDPQSGFRKRPKIEIEEPSSSSCKD